MATSVVEAEAMVRYGLRRKVPGPGAPAPTLRDEAPGTLEARTQGPADPSARSPLLLRSGASVDDVYPVLRDRAERAKTSFAATGLAAGFATWHGHAADAAGWYKAIADRATQDASASTKKIGHYSSVRQAEAERIAESKAPVCDIVTPQVVLASKLSSISALTSISTEQGVVVAWLEGIEG